jgi:porin
VRSHSRGSILNKSSHLRIAISGLAGAVLTLPCALAWADTVDANSAPGNVLLLDSLGRLVSVPSNQVPASLQPPSEKGPNRQIPEPTEGAMMPEVILQRMREGNVGVEYFPAVPPALMPYLASQDEYGNTVMRPGPLFPVAPFEPYLQDAKSWLSDRGYRYSLEQTFTYVSMTDIKKGYNNLDFYSLNLKSKWEIYSASGDDGTAGWISSQIEAKAEIGPNVGEQTPKSNLGTITDPSGIWSSVNGLRVPEVAWQQSLADGKVVALAGLVNQGNYMDRNAYAQSSGNGLFNSALVHSMVLPLPSYNFGLNLQWQPLPEWYGMMGGSVGDAAAGTAPRTGFNSAYWSVLWEFGYAPHDVFGLGPGIYRIQPFVAQVGQYTGEGLGFDLQQKLGPDSPFGWFGRFGFGD